MSFQFRRRNDVRDQQVQQEPFFQNQGSHSFTKPESPYSQIGYNNQGFEEGFRINGPLMHQSLMQPENFYGQQQPPQQMNSNFGFMQNSQFINHQQPESYLHPVQASQLNAQRINNYNNQEFGAQPNNYQSQNFAHNQQNQSQGYLNNLSAFNGIDNNLQQPHSRSAAIPNPMASWNNNQNTTRFENSDETEANSPIKLLVAVAGVSLIAALSWFAYKWAKAPSSESVPLIHAEQGSHKVYPDHRGGINIPYQDKLIYNRIDGMANNDPEERLLPPPEQPSVNQQGVSINNNQENQQVQMPNNGVPFPQGNQQQYQNNPHAAQSQQATQNLQVPSIALQQPMPQQEQQSSEIRKTKEDDIEEVSDNPKLTKRVKTPETTADTGGSYYVQLATVKSESAAIKEWSRLKNKYNLKGQKSMIKESERPDGETVFRLLMGPFSEKVKALKHAVKMDGTKVIHMTD